MRHLMLGLFCSVALASGLSACNRGDKPPNITICIGDGVGGADCKTATGDFIYKNPSELENFWITSQDDAARLLSWCYGSSGKPRGFNINDIKEEILDGRF